MRITGERMADVDGVRTLCIEGSPRLIRDPDVRKLKTRLGRESTEVKEQPITYRVSLLPGCAGRRETLVGELAVLTGHGLCLRRREACLEIREDVAEGLEPDS